METHPQSQPRRRDVAVWPTDISHFLVNHLIQTHKSGRGGDNGLRKEQFIGLAKTLNDRFQLNYDYQQVRTHYRNWKARIKALNDLRKDSGMGWNDREKRFDSASQVWADKKKPEEKFWREHAVLQIHEELSLWFENEIATGNDSVTPGEMANLNLNDNVGPVEGLHGTHVTGEVGGEDSSVPIAGAGRTRGRPAGELNRGTAKRKKGGVEKVASPLKAIAASIDNLVLKDPRKDFAREVTAAINSIPDLDNFMKWRAKIYFMRDKDKGNLLISADEDEKKNILEMCKHEIDQIM